MSDHGCNEHWPRAGISGTNSCLRDMETEGRPDRGSDLPGSSHDKPHERARMLASFA